MKINRKIFYPILGVFAFIVLFFNVKASFSDNDALLVISKLECLANCESSVEYGFGQSTFLFCMNSYGEPYVIPCCDFDPGYPEYCNGRKCGD